MEQKRKIFMLALDRDDPEKEREFEIEFQLSLTDFERYEIMDQLVKDGLEFVERNEHTNTPAIVARS